jgi:putative spermidine/putrescine transport system substrate-binding protein
MRRNRVMKVAVGVATVGIVVAGCSSGSTSGGGSSGAPAPSGTPYAGPVGQGEGQLNVLAWPGYAEDGSSDPSVDWVTPFEKDTGCQVNAKTFGTSSEAYDLMKKGGYDIVSASGDASGRMVYGDLVQPMNMDLVPSYADIFPGLKDQPYNTFNGVHYGIAQGRGANLLVYNKSENAKAPDSWKDMWDANSPFKGKVSAYDDAIYIADAATYLMATQPDLKITNPYALDRTQFDAAVQLLNTQKPLVAEYWADYAKAANGLASGSVAQAQGWQLTANTANTNGDKVGAVKPKEGATGWSDTWMIAKDTPNINCAYQWANYITSPKVNAQVTEYWGEAPSNTKSCAMTDNKDHCNQFHADDEDFWTDVHYWTTPTEQCLDGRTDVQCIPYKDWVTAWTTLRSS